MDKIVCKQTLVIRHMQIIVEAILRKRGSAPAPRQDLAAQRLCPRALDLAYRLRLLAYDLSSEHFNFKIVHSSESFTNWQNPYNRYKHTP